jgi:5'-3' exonuclease
MKRVLLIDLSGIFRAAWHSSGDQEINLAGNKTLEKVEALRAGYRYVAACCDSSPYKRRLELLPTYKGQREQPTEALIDQFRRVKARLDETGTVMWKHAGEEADDVIASAVARAKVEGFGVTIASSDKDLLQLVDDAADIEVFSPSKNKVFRRAEVIETWGVPPEKLLDALALQGDTGDNVPGIPKVGPKTAAKLLAEFGSFDGIFENADKIKTPAIAEAVALNGDAARLARKVIALRSDLPIAWEQLLEERKPVPDSVIDAEYDEVDEYEPIPMAPPDIAPPPASAPRAVQTSALRVVPQEWSLGLEPTSLGKAQLLAVALANSQMYLRFPNKDAILAVIVRGREMGIGALTSLDAFHFFQGKPAMHAHLIIDRAKKDPDCEYFRFIGGDDTYAEYETKSRRNPEPTRMRYTIEQARQAGLAPDNPRLRPPAEGKDSRGQWEKSPAQQLRKTAGVLLARVEYPGAAMGLYSVAELGGDE